MSRILALLLVFAWLPANAELMIEITEGRDDALPMAIVPFAEPGEAVPEDVAAVVSADLHRSGQFKPLPPTDLLSRPRLGENILWRDFRVLGTDYLITGKVENIGPQQYRVQYALHDVPQQKEVLAETYETSASRLRDVAHAISDRVYEHLTGVRGAFSTKILYVTLDRDQRYPFQLQYADADGARAQTILKSKEPIMSPTWSPDGSKVAYVSFESDGLPGIYIHDLATSSRKRATAFPGINGAPDWSPDGSRLAITLSRDGNPEIYSYELATGELTRLTRHYGIDTEPRWLPDGRSLVFTSSRSGGPQIYKMDLDSGNVRRLTFEGGYNAGPDVTPDGRYLVFVHRRNGAFHIGVKDLKRGTFDVITRTDMDESPSVAPNGSMIIYGTQQRGTGVLQAVSIDGRVKVNLPSREGEVREPAWSPFL